MSPHFTGEPPSSIDHPAPNADVEGRDAKTYDPYENELIGQFLMALGYRAGRDSVDIVAVGFLQQTLRDAAYGDLLLGCGSYHAIEFKRSATKKGEFPTEAKKWNLERLAEHMRGEWMRFAERGHWLVWGTIDRKEVHFAPYMRCIIPELRSTTVPAPATELIARILSVQTNLNEQGNVGQVVDGFSSAELLEAYLKDLSRFRVAEAASGGGGGMEYLGVGINAEQGVVLFSAETLRLELQRKAKPEIHHQLVPPVVPLVQPPRGPQGPRRRM